MPRAAERPHWACGKCGYDLTGSVHAERCPGCGSALAGPDDDDALGPNLVDIDDLPPHLRARVIANARGDVTVAPAKLCTGCGYDLTGLKSDRCPECGLPLRAKPKRIRDDENLITAPLEYLQRFRLATTGMALSAVTLPLALAMVVRSADWTWAALAALLAVVWSGACFVATAPRPHRGPGEMPIIRSLARWSQVVWIGVVAMTAVASAASGPSVGIAIALASALALAGLFGFVPLGEYLGMLSDWAGADSYAIGLRTSASSIILFGLFTAASVPLAAVPGLGFLLMLMPLSFLFFWLSVIAFIIVVVKLAVMAHHAVGNAREMRERDLRLAERRAAHAAEIVARQAAVIGSFGEPGFEADLAPLDPGPWRPPEAAEPAAPEEDDDLPPIPLA